MGRERTWTIGEEIKPRGEWLNRAWYDQTDQLMRAVQNLSHHIQRSQAEARLELATLQLYSSEALRNEAESDDRTYWYSAQVESHMVICASLVHGSSLTTFDGQVALYMHHGIEYNWRRR